MIDEEALHELNDVEEIDAFRKENLKAWGCFVRLSPAPVLCFDIAGRIVLANPAARELLRPEGLVGCVLNDVFPGFDGDACLRCVQEGDELSFEHTLGPRTYHFVVSGVPKLEMGHVYGTDVTALKRTEAALRENEALLRGLVEGYQDMIAILDLEGRFLYYNAPERYGLSEADVIGKTYEDFWPPDVAAKNRREFDEVLSQGQPLTVEDQVTWQGETLWFLNHKYPIRDRDGAIIAVGTLSRDITECKRAEQAKARSQRLLLALSHAAQAVQRARTPEAVYQAIGEQARALGFDAMVFTLSEDREHLIISYLTIQSDLVQAAERLVGLPMQSYRFPLKSGEVYQYVVASGETVFAEVNAARIAEVLPRPVRPLARRLASLFDWQHRIIAPLIIDGEVQGLLAFGGIELTEADIPAITAFANQAAIAIENARLYQETRRLAAFNASIVQSIADGIVVQDTEGSFTFANPAAAAMLGYTPDELMGEPWTAIIPPDQRSIVQRDGERLMRGEIDCCELEFMRKDGQRITVLVSGTPQRDAEGHVVGTMAVFTDITARKRMEETLRFQALVLNEVQNSVVVSDPEGNIVYVNAEAQRNQKREREELIGQSVEVYGEDPSRGATQQQIKERTLENREWHGEVVNYASDGTEVIVDLRTKLLRDRQGEPWRIVGIGTDITARKRMEEALRASEAQYRFLAEHVTDVITRHAADGTYLYVSPSCKRLFGFDPEALIGAQPLEFVHPDDVDRFVEDYQKQAAKRDIVRFEYRRRRKDGTYLWVENTSRIIRDPQTGDIQEVVGVLRDITARKQVEEVLLTQAEELQHTNAELQQLAHAVSHDVAAPLRMIKYGVKMVHQDCEGVLDAADDEMLSYVAEEAEWMQRLIDDLREYSRVNTRGASFSPVDCEGVLERVLRQLVLEIEHTDAMVTHDSLPTVMADEAQMVQLFQNLISNALKYHGEEPPRVHVAVEEAEDAWTFAVQDQGIGLDSQHTERIFEIFERLHTREEYDGTGVGLAVCRRIVQRHSGRIWVESKVGEGATFYFTLPKAPGDAPSG